MPKSKISKNFGHFVRQYQRKAHPNWDPNDRQYDREIEEKLKRLPPEELDLLLNGIDEDLLPEAEDIRWHAGELIKGLIYRKHSIVAVTLTDERGTIIDVVSAEPQPRYMLELDNSDTKLHWENELQPLID